MKGKIFNTQEVQSIIAGNKTMFREVVKPQPTYQVSVDVQCGNEMVLASVSYPKEAFCLPEFPYQVGQKIFVKESFVDFRNNNSEIFYKSDFEVNNLVETVNLKWEPVQHMKQEHSRLTLLIKEITVERLAEIKPIDCVHEGIWKAEDVKLGRSEEALNAFAKSWNATHKKPEEKFEESPWVWSILFEVVK